MQSDDVFVISPAGQSDPAVVIAACRAGARGTLDLEYSPDPAVAQSMLARIAEFTDRPFGVKLRSEATSLIDELLAVPRAALRWVIVAGGDHPQLPHTIERLRAAGLQILFEAVNVAEMQRGIEIGADGLILKGHEAGGRIGDQTSFILIQRWFRQVAPTCEHPLPVWIQGGIGLNTAAACVAAGAQGVVLDAQILLARECRWSDATRNWLRSFDGSQTAVFGEALGDAIRVAQWPRSPLTTALAADVRRISDEVSEPLQRRQQWRDSIAGAWKQDLMLEVRTLGQDAASAAHLADRFRTVGGIVEAIVEHARRNLETAQRLRPLDAGAPLAESHGTRYPILQGPMTRVSDTAPFAEAVAREGGLPFLALALLRKAEVEVLLRETSERLGSLPWGAGILGFLPPEIRLEQTAAILAAKPPFVLIAGGRPDQAREFEEQGMPTYLHVPSPGLMRMFLKDGARRFILEGRECGGHVGPRTSFVLWDATCEAILEHLGPNASGADLHVVFAGGIHDELSSAMVAATAARLAQRGVRVGVLMGTAYLFTQEAVASGTIVDRFQQEAIRCEETVLLETGPGHAIRCVPTPYCDSFREEKQKLEAEGRPAEEITRRLEWMNVGRLRVASKGVDHAARSESGPKRLTEVGNEEQYARGMYMIGQVASLRGEITTVADLHASVSTGATQWLAQHASAERIIPGGEGPCDVAIIGASCFYPGAGSLEEYWSNVLRSVYAVTEVPESHWDWSLYYDPDPMAKDKIVSKWGGFLKDIAFDPFRFGIAPAAMKVIEPLQFLLLEAVRQALGDSGYAERPFARERTAAICGIGGGGSPMATLYGFRTCMPLVNRVPGIAVSGEQILEQCAPLLPEWTEDSFPGFLMNVAVGRVANRFDLGGPNYAIDAACASSLAALQLAVRELQSGTSDVALAMGADTVQTPFAYMAFSKTFALSRAGRCRPFDAAADGIVLSEGIGVVVLKRLADAERDGDRIMAVIRGVGSSSDGRDKGLTAPNASGQVRALERAYRQAQISPARLELVEAHGTGTVVGDRTEAEALGTFLRRSGAEASSCAVGSVKSMVGHSKCAAGIAGLIKTTMALHHKVLPPTIVETPNPNAGFVGGPLYLNTSPRPWVHGGPEPRTAGVSAFGFGGTNFHVVLEEYTGDFVDGAPAALRDWDTELIVCRQPTREKLLAVMQQVQQGLSRGGQPRLVDLAATLWRGSSTDPSHPVLAIVAATVDELREKLPLIMPTLRGADNEKIDPRGVYFSATPHREPVAMLFPGQGSQYPNMLSDVALEFPCVREELDRAELGLTGKLPRPLGKLLFPPSEFDDDSRRAHEQELARTQVAQPALAATSLGMFSLLRRLGVQPDFVAGHSSGEYVALCAAGCLTPADLIQIAAQRGALMGEAGGDGAMAAVACGALAVTAALQGLAGVTLANMNSPTQTVISGERSVLESAVKRLETAGHRAAMLNVSGAFHSPQVATAADRLATDLAQIAWNAPQVEVFANVTGKPYPHEPAAIGQVLSQHMTSPVRFIDEIEAMYAAGVRVFVESGPSGVLTGLVKQILGDRAHTALATDLKGRPGIVQLAHTLAQLLVRGVTVDCGVWQEKRIGTRFELADLEKQSIVPPRTPNTWIVNSVRARPLNAPEPPLLGQRLTPDRWPGTWPETPAVVAPLSAASSLSQAAPQVIHQGDLNLRGQNAPTNLNGKEPMKADHMLQVPPTSNNGAGRPAIAAPLATTGEVVDDTTVVMCRHQDLMARFLECQQAVLHDYFQAVSGGTLPAQQTTGASFGQNMELSHAAPVQMPTIQPTHAPQVEAPVAMSAPVPTVTAEVIAAAPTALAPIEARSDALVAAPTKVTRDELTRRLLDLVCKRTGYPQDMLDLDLDLEADLGVDSIKRVEILGTLAESLGGKESELGGRIELEKLTVLRTLRGILDYLDQAALGDGPADAPASRVIAHATTTSKHAATNGAHLALPHEPAANGNGHAASHGTNGSTNGSAHGATNGSLHSATNGASHGGTNGSTQENGSAHQNGDANGHAEVEVQRALVELFDVPLPPASHLTIPAGTLILTDDGRGIAGQLEQRLADFGQRVAYVRHTNAGVRLLEEDVYQANLSDPLQVDQLLELVRKESGTIGGLIHLSSLAKISADETSPARATRDVKSLYLLARACEADICRAGAAGGGVLLGAMSLGGNLGFAEGPLSPDYQAGHGGIAGLLKCVSQEWDNVLVRAVDVDLSLSAEVVADLLLAELTDRDGPTEVGVSRGRRVTWRPAQAPLDDSGPESIELAEGAPVLITGGARGITAKVAVALARRYRPHLILVGRTALPEGNEPADVAGQTDQAKIKQALIERLRSRGESAAPSAVEALYRRLLAAREVAATLDEIDQAGATWEYHAIDVRDTAEFGRLIQELNCRGGVQGVIHGAGVIEDRLLRDKTPESFDRVFQTKVNSTFVLAEKLDPKALKFCILFASLASRYGNRGQSDYAAANEVLSKLAIELDRKWPGRVCSIAWGPWSGVGMVAELEPHLTRRGLKLISPDEGPQYVLDDIAFGRKGDCEVIVAGGAERLVRPRPQQLAESH